MNVTHFATAREFRSWLVKNHASVTELHVGFYKKNSGIDGMTYKEAVDEALCFGWIDGVMRKIDDVSFTHRFTPRKPSSIWSNVNVGHVARLIAAGKMHAAGLRAFEKRKAAKTGVYSFEQKRPAKLGPVHLQKFKASTKAWKFFSAQAPWYQRLVIHKITTAKREATREAWLDRAIDASARGVRLEG